VKARSSNPSTSKKIRKRTNNSIEDLVGNEENKYSVPDSNRMMLIMTNEPNEVHKKSLKQKIISENIERVIKKLQDMVKLKVQDKRKQY
jgi:hypothetical protein